jgi:acyl-coenzyme A thioesterase PaaI-like protein
MSLFKLDFSGSGSSLFGLWQSLSPFPGGRWFFGQVLGLINPYTGSLRARVLELGPGKATIELRERRAVRNHVDSVHAIALMNLAEMATGLALMSGLPENARGIPKKLSIEYIKKARGRLIASTSFTPPQTAEQQELEIVGTIENASGEVVARATALWRIGPKP